MKKVNGTITVLIFALLIFCYSCHKDEKTSLEAYKTNKSNSFGKRPDNCDCGTRTQSWCTDQCTEQFMNGNNSRSFKIIWNSCNTSDPSYFNCNFQPTPGLPLTSNVTFCYQKSSDPNSNGCSLLMQVDRLPTCIACITTFPRCITFKAWCNVNGDGTGYLSLEADDPDLSSESGTTWSVTIDGDPVIKICCQKMGANGFQERYCCEGDLIPN